MEEYYFISMIISMIWSVIAIQIAKNKSFFKIPQKEIIEQRLTAIAVLSAFVIFLGTQIASALFFSYSPWKEPLGILTCALALWGFMELVPGLKKIVWGRETFISHRRSLYNLGLGAMTWLICYPLLMVFNQTITLFLIHFTGKPQLDQLAVRFMKEYLGNPYYFLTMAFIVCVVVPMIEEVLFRGFLQNLLKEYLGMPYAIGLASIIFALFHYSPDQGVYNIGILSGLFMLSCFLGFIYERQRSLLAPIGLHCVFNSFTVLLIFYEL